MYFPFSSSLTQTNIYCGMWVDGSISLVSQRLFRGSTVIGSVQRNERNLYNNETMNACQSQREREREREANLSKVPVPLSLEAVLGGGGEVIQEDGQEAFLLLVSQTSCQLPDHLIRLLRFW